MGEPTAQEKRRALETRPGNTLACEAITIAGHAGAGYYDLKGLRAAFAAGNLATKGGPLAAAFVGGWIANEVHADEGVLKIAEVLGAAERQASPGPEPAHFGHTIAHNHEFGGFLAGLVVGVVAGVLAAATGGLAVPLLIGAAGGFGAEAVAGAGAKMADVTGTIAAGSPNVRFEGQPVARVGDSVECSKDSGPDLILEGSRTIRVNSMPLARVGHKTICGAVIQQGCRKIRADTSTIAYGLADGDLVERAVMSFSEIMFARWFGSEGEAEEPPPDTETVAKTGEPSAATTNRTGEHPYSNPRNMQTVKPGQPLDLNRLDPGKKYLWVVDPDGNILVAPENQPGLGRDLKHGDLTPGPLGKSRGPARAGGELTYNPETGHWEMNNDSSYTFAREDGQHLDGDNLNAARDLLAKSGTDTSKIDTVNSHGSDATGR